jgi:hypothetical protein
MSESEIVVVVPLGQALLRVVIADNCEEADRLRATLSGPVLVCCRCRLARLLLAEASPAEADLIARFGLALNAVAGPDS